MAGLSPDPDEVARIVEFMTRPVVLLLLGVAVVGVVGVGVFSMVVG